MSQPVVIAEELGDVTALAMSANGRWLALGLGLQVWVIQVAWKMDSLMAWTIKDVKHKATLDGHKSSIFKVEFLNGELIGEY